MSSIDVKYINLCKQVIREGVIKGDRTGTGTISLFGAEIRHDLSESFPILTTKDVHFKSVLGELLWFLRGDTNIAFLRDNGIKIWDAWATEDGEVGDMYGAQWRGWDSMEYGFIDQIDNLIFGIINNPNSRRHLVSAWNVGALPEEKHSPYTNVSRGQMALAPCHYSFQCYVADGKLSMIVNQRSADLFLGVPFNIASYALLTHMLAQVCGLKVGELIWRGGDVHIYSNHVEQINEQITRYENGEVYAPPKLEIDTSVLDIDDFTFDSMSLVDYKNAGKLKGKVAV